MQVCNSVGQCHCDNCFDPPVCSQPGRGGSYHSNPACVAGKYIAINDYVTVCGFPLIPGSGRLWVSDRGGRAAAVVGGTWPCNEV